MITVKSESLIELLNGAYLNADRGKNGVYALSHVKLELAGERVKATGTDRYRLIMGEIAGEGESVGVAYIGHKDIKDLMTWCKKFRLVSLTIEGESLRLEGDKVAKLELRSSDINYPSYESIVELCSRKSESVEEIGFNPSFMADYAKLCDPKQGIRLVFSGEKYAIKVILPNNLVEWTALIMPMKNK